VKRGIKDEKGKDEIEQKVKAIIKDLGGGSRGYKKNKKRRISNCKDE